jgi:hypothetical protein
LLQSKYIPLAPRVQAQPASASTKIIRRTPLDTLVDLAGERPVYIICSPALPSWRTDMVADHACRKYPAARFVNSRGPHGSRAAWLARWPKERGRYGGGIVLTAAEPLFDGEPPTGGNIPGAHGIADGAAREIVDLVALAKPMLWLAMFDGRLRQIATFSIEQPVPSFMGVPSLGPGWRHFVLGPGWRHARLFHAIDAAPLIPVIGSLPPLRGTPVEPCSGASWGTED